MLLINLDPQANATSAIGFEDIAGHSIYEPLIGTVSVAERSCPRGSKICSLFLPISTLPAPRSRSPGWTTISYG